VICGYFLGLLKYEGLFDLVPEQELPLKIWVMFVSKFSMILPDLCAFNRTWILDLVQIDTHGDAPFYPK